MTLDNGKVVLNIDHCEITVGKTEEGTKLYLQQGGHIVVLTEPEWKEVKRAADRALNFMGEVSS